MLTPGARTVTAALRATGLAAACRFTHDHRVLNRATWSARQGRRILLGWLITLLVPPDAPIVLGADDTVDRRSGRKIAASSWHTALRVPRGTCAPRPDRPRMTAVPRRAVSSHS
ncbi:MAG: transposase [Candidatus Tectomicrobia bacterium]|nr:transposase [Candidatus Tectomicrobia bacterium]